MSKSKAKIRGHIAKPGASQAPPVTADPLVWLVNRLHTDEDGDPLREGIFSNYNDDIVIEADPMTLVARIDPERGPAQRLEIGDGLRVENGVLIGEGGGEKGDPGPVGPPGPPGPVGPAGASSSMFLYRYDTNTTPSDPGAGRYRQNSLAPTVTTRLFVDRLTQDGLDPTAMFKIATFDDEFIIQERGLSAHFQHWRMTAPALDRTDWFEIPVEFVSQQGANFSNNQEVTFLVRTRGEPGPQGVKGDQGNVGPPGPIGNTGPQGPVGGAGPVGATGAKGDTGSQGPQGIVGPQGSTGPQGIQGNVGATGAKGDTGNTGSIGPTGPIGPEGPVGPQGIPGVGVSTVYVGDGPPAGVPDNTLWWESDSGLLYLRYRDQDDTVQWVIAAPQPDFTGMANVAYVDAGDAAAVAHADAGDANTLKYVAQTLTTPQREQARQNIFAAPFDALAYNGMQFNSSMDVAQEFGTSSGTVNGHYCDGYYTFKSGTMAIISGKYSAAGTFQGFANYLFISISTAQASLGSGDTIGVLHNIEGYRIARLGWGTANAQPITLGFWTFHTRTGIYSVGIRNAALTRAYVCTYTQNVSNAAEYKTITIPGCIDGVWNVDNAKGVEIIFSMGSGSGSTTATLNTWLTGTSVYVASTQVNAAAATTDNFRITGLVVLPGNEAPSAVRSPFIMRPYDQELLLCQRYFQKVICGYQGVVASGQYWSVTHTYAPSMRAMPSVSRISDYFLNGFNTPFSERITAEGFMSTALSNAAGSCGWHTLYACNARL